MNIQRQAILVLAAAGMATGTTWAGPGDHTQHGLVRSAPSSDSGGAAPTASAPPASAPAASAPAPAAAAPPSASPSAPPTSSAPSPRSGLVHARGSGTPREQRESAPSSGGASSIGTAAGGAPAIAGQGFVGAPRASVPRHFVPGVTQARVEQLRRTLTPNSPTTPADQPTVATVSGGTGGGVIRASRDSTVRSLMRSTVVPSAGDRRADGPGTGAPDHTRSTLVRTSNDGPTFGGSHHDWNGNGNGGGWTWGGSGCATWTNGCATCWPTAWNTVPNTTYYTGWWSSGIPSTLQTGCNDPWSYATFSYGGPGWNLPATYEVPPYSFTYEPYLGADVWQFEQSPFVGAPAFVGGPVFLGGFSSGLADAGSSAPAAASAMAEPAPEPLRYSPQSFDVKLWHVNPAYDVRSDFNASVDAALQGEFSTAIYAMRRAASVNPGALASPAAPVVRSVASDAETSRRVWAAMAVFRHAPVRVVSETDAAFMTAALMAAVGDGDGARRATDDAMQAGDGAMSTQMLAWAIRQTQGEGP